MSDPQSNVNAIVAAHLARARVLYDEGVDKHRQAAEEILAARTIDPKLSDRAVGRAMGISHTTVARLMIWHRGGADRTTPFGGETNKREARSFRKTTSDPPEDAIDELRAHPEIFDRVFDVDDDDEPDDTEPTAGPWSQPLDIIEMGEHRLLVGSADSVFTKDDLMYAIGLGGYMEDDDLDVVVVSDPPFGQKKRGITNDHLANWATAWSLLKPRGGFVYSSPKPDLLKAAWAGIEESGGTVVHLLIELKGGGQLWESRLQNRFDIVLYWERTGAPWIEGRKACSVLLPDLGRAAMDERKRMAGGHPTPKHISTISQLIEVVTDLGDLVLDPFSGSGTCLIACQRTGRRFIGIELEPKWADVAVRNWQHETGRTAMVWYGPMAYEPVEFGSVRTAPEPR